MYGGVSFFRLTSIFQPSDVSACGGSLRLFFMAPPSFHACQDDKTRHVQQNPPLNDEAAHFIDIHFSDRWRSIAGVDDMIELLLNHLELRGVLNNTFVFMTSDHGGCAGPPVASVSD